MGLLEWLQHKPYQFTFECRKCGRWWQRDSDSFNVMTMQCKCGNHVIAYHRHVRA